MSPFPREISLMLTHEASIGSFYAFILSQSTRVRLAVVARSNYDAVKNNV